MAKMANSLPEILNIIEENIAKIIPRTVEIVASHIEIAVKPEIIARCPSAQEEAIALSKDTSGIGVPDDGRFMRAKDGGEGIPVKEAVQLEKPIIGANFVGFGSASGLNAKTVFSWYNRTYDEMRTTTPFYGQYIQALEWGGLSWTVKPRSGTKALHPEEGVFRASMTKQLYPHLMFTKGSSNTAVIAELKKRIAEGLKQW